MGIAERRQREKSERRADILRAAERVFLSQGLDETTMEQIAREAEVGKGTLYLYFQSKDELFFAIQLATMQELNAFLVGALQGGGRGLDRVERMLEAHARFAAQHPKRFKLCNTFLASSHSLDESAPQFEQYRAAASQMFQLVVQAIEQGQDDGTVRRDYSAKTLAVHLWGASMGALVLQSRAPELQKVLPVGGQLEDVVVAQVQLLCAGLRPLDNAFQSGIHEVSA